MLNPAARRPARPLFILLASLVAFPAFAVTPPSVAWLTRYQGTIGNNQVTAMVLDAAGNAYVTGYSEGIGWDMATVKYNAAGQQVWVARYDGGHGGDDVPSSIALDNQGNVLVGGYSDAVAFANHDYLTLKYDSLGVLQWHQTYSDPANQGLDQITSLAVDGSGNIYVTGDSWNPTTRHDAATLKYSPAGALLWVRRWDGTVHDDDAGSALALDPDGNVYVTGLTNRSNTTVNHDVITLKYSTTGTLLWSDQYNGAANGNDSGVDLAVDAARNVYAAGFATGIGGRFDGLLIKIAPAGTETWVRTYDDPVHYFDSFNAIALSPLGKICVTGFGSPSGSDSDYLTIQYDPNGNAEWTGLYDGPVHGFDSAQSVACDGDGNVYVTGNSDGGATVVDYDYATLRYSPSGAVDWVVRYDGGAPDPYGIDVAEVVAVGPENSIYVSGWSTGNRSPYVDFATIRYDQQGSSGIADGTPGIPDAGIRLAGPNPFSQATRLGFTLPAAGRIDLSLWDASGRKVGILARGAAGAGRHEVAVDGASLVPGVYFARLRTEEGEAATRIVRIR